MFFFKDLIQHMHISDFRNDWSHIFRLILPADLHILSTFAPSSVQTRAWSVSTKVYTGHLNYLL